MPSPVMLWLLLIASPPPATELRLSPNRTEIGLLPALSYDSDLGLGVGALGAVAKFAEGQEPYAWRLEALGYLTIKENRAGELTTPFHDDYLMLDLPNLWEEQLRLTLKLGFGRYSNSGYYGLGNAAPFVPALQRDNERYYRYDRTYPYISGVGRVALARPPEGKLDLMTGAAITHSRVRIYPGSLLEEHLQAGAPALRGIDPHLLTTAMLGLLWDSRDHETAPTRGALHDLSLRGGISDSLNLGFGGLNGTLRGYLTLSPGRLVLAGRVMADLLFGEPPLYELASHGGYHVGGATGGASSLRGIWAQRRHGKVKLLGNAELRLHLVPFSIAGERFRLGLIAFADAGRVWAELGSQPRLDGEGIGLALGCGGGVRLLWGETFMIRADGAWSPTDQSDGLYVDVNHVF